ncbi:hypothetical protein BJAS_P0290 [Bathymodiolus japonicus methanotrophic gill symbiont]|uniref:hypothetical protein n=1 Tax=Bathymodiolus japonicus methanotrophic gill symbiont TaxID=113269 RepID=UPI001B4D7B3E|nr:hypothetical protein [Bathymodiolus japonicus methanotrophic gill symbiont]GFO71073.1 hypothetical protein BJAS_P0290 [Bathymodiolus japonicus methanotrophic gill symbiont]
MGDALNALRPQRLRTKAASSLLPHWLDGYSECNSCSSRVLLAHVESANCPVAYQGLKIFTSLKLRFQDFQRLKKSGIAKKDRPIKPERDSAYPTKTEIALGLLKEFKVAHSLIKIKGVLADALYGEKPLWTKPLKNLEARR